MRRTLMLSGALGFLAILVATATAEVPPLLNFQGKLTDLAGSPVKDSAYSMEFRIYDDSTGGNVWWSEAQPAVHVENGLFNVLMGSVVPVPDSAFSGPNRWLTFLVDGAEMLPRQRIASVAYAYNSNEWGGAGTGQMHSTHLTDNVGIGTSTPDGKLDIVGGLFTSTNLVLGANYIDSWRWRMKTIDRGDGIDLDFTVSDVDDHEQTVMQLSRSLSGRPEFAVFGDGLVFNNGSVGIGTDDPRSLLHLNGIAAPPKLTFQDSNNPLGGIQSIRVLGGIGGYMSVSSDVGEALVIRRVSGNVGIGTTDPQAKLDVAGTMRLNLSCRIYADNVNYHELRHNSYTGDFEIVPTGSHRLRVKGDAYFDGNVGIGTTDPGSFRLAVEGKIGAREVVVTATSPWPDYVFTKTYELQTLNELEREIKKNGCLPGMPSAQQVKDSGLSIGDMQAKLLLKIEELTLHLIELNKQNEALRARVTSLEAGRKWVE